MAARANVEAEMQRTLTLSRSGRSAGPRLRPFGQHVRLATLGALDRLVGMLPDPPGVGNRDREMGAAGGVLAHQLVSVGMLGFLGGFRAPEREPDRDEKDEDATADQPDFLPVLIAHDSNGTPPAISEAGCRCST